MRKINAQMLSAIRGGRNWQSGNTSIVFHDMDWKSGLCSVFLHGNWIATVNLSTMQATPNVDTFRNWPTRTTVSRLRALGINAAIRKGKPTINGEAI